ncbi:imidazole glycerol phosphate synthase subunit HisH [Vibrio anguillarum]|uniref:Imidazole glycerol phosphate synthase subunit HisH n=13 Tax=Vibrio anguillarum TaxID=55601 RepID=A0A289GF74_VIBAN|nr:MULTISPECIES: imidazole glycerol phosphate synthase subunit HisH [Vibrio]ASW82195.1 imidazole glycerol phosphate synthase subunit HisH [Vibrio anguillarum]ATC58712.1 imidazole glycerol phosphate synthase subunit HisH [Vibrio anguillarum]AXN05012.1 imidazole glycerol phosphate synthase subunit HisH [Vibrio anguillarum]AZS24750.1 imidazole glycerol phosphate synthase subunit HisH [Vibrio anguillarum]MBF4222536.1 imidazole glycerol phosphate synthase subunit HisH [Vibrio anguillarum]
MIKILDYGMGNCGSIKNMLRYLGAEAEIVDQSVGLENSKAIILPGVGSYDHGVKHLEPFKAMLEQKVLHEKIPFLGICLGMQLVLEKSEEGQLPGLGWIKGEVKRFDFSKLTSEQRHVIPHMGWNEIFPAESPEILQPLEADRRDRFYFVHSYHAADVPSENKLAICHYGYEFTCAIRKNNIFGVQFHPEKSHKFGKQLFKQFIELIQC